MADSPVYTAATDAAARFHKFTDTCGERYQVIIALWRSAWSAFLSSQTK